MTDIKPINKEELHLIPYNTGMQRLMLPEYGRGVQEMANYCLTIEDRDERLRCARTIIKIMAKLTPKESHGDGCAKLWDHLNIMCGFKLDIDFPCEVTDREHMNPKPDKIPYSTNSVENRVYGNNLVRLVEKVGQFEPGAERDAQIFVLANEMKKFMIMSSPDSASDARIFNDIARITHGRIVLDPENMHLNDYIAPAVAGKKKKRKK